MKILELLNSQPKDLTVSVEITPPMRGTSINTIFKAIEDIRSFNPLWIDVTSHAADVNWVEQSGGVYRKHNQRKSPGTIAICGAIEFKFGIPTVPHILCHGFTCEETEDALIDLNYLGIRNVLAIRGDGQPKEKPAAYTSNKYALDLVKQIRRMNRGEYLYQKADPTDFSVGVACYPEKHFEAPNFSFDIAQLKAKQQEGAVYANTQMFFDNTKFYQFIDRVEKAGVTIPIIPSLKIFNSASQLTTIPRHFFVDLPEELVKKVERAKDKQELEDIGIDWACKQCEDLMAQGFKHIHFYIMKKTSSFNEVMRRLNVPKLKRLKKANDHSTSAFKPLPAFDRL